MDTVEKEAFDSFLTQQDEPSWLAALDVLLPLIHPVDQDATRIWFTFWPLQLHRILKGSDHLDQTAQKLELQGGYLLEQELGNSLGFLFGSQYWSQVQQAVQAHAADWNQEEAELVEQIQEIARRLSSGLGVPESQLLGITAVALMARQQVGPAVFAASSVNIPTGSSPERLLRARSQKKRGLLGFLRTVDARHTVVFNERDPACHFTAIHGQDLSMAAGADVRDYRAIDPRRTEGPVPFQCRVGTCGTCWVGLLGGKERLSPINDSERQGLKRFGYDFGSSDQESHPPIRLACQAKCLGDVSIAISPWNGVLNMQRFER